MAARLLEPGYRHLFPGTSLFLEGKEQFRVVITDIVMPELDGLGVVAATKDLPYSPSVIVMTGYSTVNNAVKAMKLGAFDYLMKPCDMDVLIEKVNAAVSKKRDHEEKIREARVNVILKARP